MAEQDTSEIQELKYTFWKKNITSYLQNLTK